MMWTYVLFDQSLNENNASQTNTSSPLQPTICTKANKHNNRYFLEFNGNQRMTSEINLNVPSGGQDIVNVYIVFKLNSFSNSLFKNGLFGHDNGGYDKFVAFVNSGDLIIAGTTNNFIIIGTGSFQGNSPIAAYQTKANPSELNKWCCLSIHWNVPAGANESSVWCNGKQLANFEARTSAGSNQMTFGDLDPNGIAGLNGSIILFGLQKGQAITDTDIKLHHHVFCNNWYKIDHDPITLG